MINIAFLTEGLTSGGSERQMMELARHLDPERFRSRVLYWAPRPFYGKQYAEIDTRPCLRQHKLDVRPILLAAQWLRSGEVDLLHAYGDTGNLYAALARFLARRGGVVASERSSKRAISSLQRVHKPWAHQQADLTIANSQKGRAFVLELTGLPEPSVLFIPNGVDTSRFAPVPDEERRALRRKWGWPEDRLIVLSVGRFRWMKNYPLLAHAMARLQEWERMHVCWIGRSESEEGREVERCVTDLGLADRIDRRPDAHDIHEAYQAADVLVHASTLEGTPNVVVEAMACGLPVVAMDVGDIARYVRPGETGWLLPASAGSDADAWAAMLRQAVETPEGERACLGRRARQVLLDLGLDMKCVARRHEEIYIDLSRNGARIRV